MTRQCFTRQKGSVTTKACLRGRVVSVEATLPSGKKIGDVEVDVVDGALMVGHSHVHPGFRRLRIGTALYEAVTDVGCRTGLPVRSDDTRSPFAEAFWRKQQGKGRARCMPGVGHFYEGPVKHLTPEERSRLPEPERHAADPSIQFWPCQQYEITAPCSVPDLEGAQRRRRR